MSVPGLEPLMVTGMMAEIRDIHRFRDQSALAKFASLFWRLSESGFFRAEETQLGSSDNPYLRYCLIEAANSVRMHNADTCLFNARQRSCNPRTPIILLLMCNYHLLSFHRGTFMPQVSH